MTVITHKLFTFLLHSGAQFYGLHFEFMEKETRKQELCLHGYMLPVVSVVFTPAGQHDKG